MADSRTTGKLGQPDSNFYVAHPLGSVQPMPVTLPPMGNRDILDALSFQTVWQSLGGGPMTGRGDNRRARAFWRNGDGFSVAVNLRSRIWKCHVSGDGGGMVDLVKIANSCDRVAAWRWLSELSGIPLRNVSRTESDRYRRAMDAAKAEAEQLWKVWQDARDSLAASASLWFRLYHAQRDELWNGPALSTEERAALRCEIADTWSTYSARRAQQETLSSADPHKLINILRQSRRREA